MSTCMGAPAPHLDCPHGQNCDWGRVAPELCHCAPPIEQHLRSTCPYEGLDLLCGAGNFAESMRRGVAVTCTLPENHPVWTVAPNDYSYNHNDEDADLWWNDGAPPAGMSTKDWMNGPAPSPPLAGQA